VRQLASLSVNETININMYMQENSYLHIEGRMKVVATCVKFAARVERDVIGDSIRLSNDA